MKIDFSKLPNKAPDYDLVDLLEAGCHFGHQKAKRHPRMDEYIYTEKDGVHIFDLAITAKQLQKAYNFVYDQAAKGKTMVMVGTKKQAKELVETTAKSCGASFITARWLGGFLTNWTQVKRSLKRMLTIESGLAAGKFDGYTKFEKVQLDKEKNKLARFFEGLRDLKNSPDFLFVIDIKREKNAIAEAKVMGIPVVAIVDTNSDPEGIDIVIPANDDAVRSLSFLITQVTNAFAEGKKGAGKSVTVPKAPAAKVASPTPVVAKPADKPVVKAEATPVAEKKAETKVEETKSVKAEPKTEEAKTVKKKAPAKAKKAAPKKATKKAEVKSDKTAK